MLLDRKLKIMNIQPLHGLSHTHQPHATAPAECLIVTAGSTYLDIDAYACAVAMAELLRIKGHNAIAYSTATTNYSVCPSLSKDGQLQRSLPAEALEKKIGYVIVDVSDPDYIKDSVPLDQVIAVYDHHVGFESYWQERIGDSAHIEFIGAAATLIYREWKNAGLEEKIRPDTARLLIAAILDNTLNLTSSNTTAEDREVFEALCKLAAVDEKWCAAYFSEVQTSVEADLKNALFNDLKLLRDHEILPERIAQLCVWDADRLWNALPDIRAYFGAAKSWMINVIDIRHQCSYFVCDDLYHQTKIEKVFDVRFDRGVAKSPNPYLRKQILKKCMEFSMTPQKHLPDQGSC